MKELINRLTEGKRVAILGYGREGRSSYNLIRNLFPEKLLGIIDNNEEISKDPDLSSDPKAILHLGSGCMKQLLNYDLVIKAPGISFHVLPEGFDKSRITSQTSLFLQEYGKQVIGVTGTKGKSTTSSLIHHILSCSGFHSILLGNIGLPPFEGIPEITEATLIVMELSSHQLEFLSKSPHIALLLNIFQEHLDHYVNYEAYQQAKMNIGKFQDKNDFFIYSSDNKLLDKLVEESEPLQHILLPYSLHPLSSDGIFRTENAVWMKREGSIKKLFDVSPSLSLPGEHNFSNIMAAVTACHIAGVSPEKMRKAISSFKGLEHRIEFVGEYDGIQYFNDSIATIPEATIEAVKTLQKVGTLILGGYDRGIDYHILYPFLVHSGIDNLIFIGEAGKRMKSELLTSGIQAGQAIYEAGNYEEVVEIAKRVTVKGKICLLSPAASSFDMFKNFEHRGEIYKKNVRSNATSHP
ncbi:MAG: UDP-N-acetylmuramoyl-L-alanine--D-glutamate ligase [Bacteroidetes bacterium]|nr:UDP-N-acetylmuramoyl-L-alanine--D-glutamate ligase [Bacteroidota bacterium]